MLRVLWLPGGDGVPGHAGPVRVLRDHRREDLLHVVAVARRHLAHVCRLELETNAIKDLRRFHKHGEGAYWQY